MRELLTIIKNFPIRDYVNWEMRDFPDPFTVVVLTYVDSFKELSTTGKSELMLEIIRIFENLLDFTERKIRSEYQELTEAQKLIFGQKELGNRELLETIPRNEDDEYDDFLEPPDRIEYFDAQNTAVAEIIFCYWMGGITPCADNYTFSFRCQEELLEPFMNRLLECFGIGAIHEILYHYGTSKKRGFFGKILDKIFHFF
ncbi:MAG: hypothetical protein Q4C70_00640 [Planctomycetia bacterium]|nr:hypothetical protein [Planctomycetia bacterium]